MIDKSRSSLSAAVKKLRDALSVTQTQFAKRLSLSAASVAHFETGNRRPDAVSALRLCREAVAAHRIDLAEVFVATLPGVEEGLLIPRWRLPVEQTPVAEKAAEEPPENMQPMQMVSSKPVRMVFSKPEPPENARLVRVVYPENDRMPA